MMKIEQGRIDWKTDFSVLADKFLNHKVRLSLHSKVMRLVRALSEQVKAASIKDMATLVSGRGIPILPVVRTYIFPIAKCGTAVHVATGTGVDISIAAGLAQRQASMEKLTRHRHTECPPRVSRRGSTNSFSCHTLAVGR